MKITIKYFIIILMDSAGNAEYRVVQSMSDTVRITSLTPTTFESEAKHLKKWANDNELTYEKITMERDLVLPKR